MKKIVVASTNPVKINSAKDGFAKMFPNDKFEVHGIFAPSGVAEQPMTEEETLKGAINRIENISKEVPDADFWVGIEGGLEEIEGEMEAFAWMVVKSKEGRIGKGRSASFFLPKNIVRLIKAGKDLSEADDLVFGRTNSKLTNGAVGILTDDVVTRTTYYESGMILALIPFRKPELY